MKRFLIVWTLLLTVSGSVFAQDYIQTKDGRSLEVQIDSVSTTTVSYHLYGQPDGPLFRLPLENVETIEFSTIGGQTAVSTQCVTVVEEEPEVRTVSNHSFSWMPVLGLEYSYEGSVGRDWTLIGRAGLTPAAGVFIPEKGSFQFVSALALTFEPRWYFSLQNRARSGKRTYGNSSEFLALRTNLFFADDGPMIRIIPTFGIRRTGGRHFFHECTVGPYLALYDGESAVGLHLNYRIGFFF